MKNKDWDFAIETGGFYFARACCLGVEAPSKEVVEAFTKKSPKDDDFTIIGKYHEKVMNAESQAATDYRTN